MKRLVNGRMWDSPAEFADPGLGELSVRLCAGRQRAVGVVGSKCLRLVDRIGPSD